MTDFLGAVARRAMGEPVGLRPLATPWIRVPDERREVAARPPEPAPTPRPARRLDPTDPDLASGTPMGESRAEPTEPASETHVGRRMGRRRPSIGVLDDDRPAEAGTEGAIPVGTRSAEGPRSVHASARRPHDPEREPSRSVVDPSIAQTRWVMPAAARPLTPPRMTDLLPPEGALRPLAALDRSMDDRDQRDRESLREDAPVVHVSIGRIEVRAPQQPPARPMPTPIPPGLTLDAYLRRRDGDGHR
jgi:hypothetical protein